MAVTVVLSACGTSVADTIAKAEDTQLTPHQRCVAIDDLHLEGGRAVAPLQQLAHDPNAEVAKCAREAIEFVDGPGAEKALYAVLGDVDPRVVASAASGLGRIGGSDAVAALLPLLGHKDPRVVASAAEALGWTRDHRAAAPLLGLLGSPNGKVLAAAASALSDIGGKSIVPDLEKIALRRGATPASDKAGRQGRRAAVEVLGNIGDPSARATLVHVLGTDPACSKAAGRALAQIFRDDVTPLMPLLESKANIALAFGLVDMGQEGTQPALVAALRRYGGYDLALYFLNCGDDKLESAAENWAHAHGYTVFTTPGIGGDEEWGSAR